MTYDKQKSWAQYLTLAELWYNTSYHSAIKTTPFEALYGYAPPQLALGSTPKSQVESVDVILKDKQAALRQLTSNLMKAQERMKRYADGKRSERKFNTGDWVYLKLQPYRQTSVSGLKNQKLSSRYYGPYEVLQRIGTSAYRLNLPSGSQIHPVFHVSQLNDRIGDTHAVSPNLPLLGLGGKSSPVPIAILARRMVKKRNAAESQLLIQWLGQEMEDVTWEPYNSIARQFPEFLLEVENRFKEGGLSRANNELRVIQFDSELVKGLEEE